jgi:hypothetical protein
MGIAVFPAPAAAAGVKPLIAEFTSSGTWTAPTGVTTAEIFIVGGGGGGGGGYGAFTNYFLPTGGGGGGAVVKKTVAVSPGTGYSVTIGSGGAGGTATATTVTNGGNGGNSSFGSLATAFGGTGGGSWSDNASPTWVGFSSWTNYGPGGGAPGNLTTSNNTEAGGGGGALTGYIPRGTANNSMGSGTLDYIYTDIPTIYPISARNRTKQGTPGNAYLNKLYGQSMGNPGIEGYGGGGGGGWVVGAVQDSTNNKAMYGLGRDGGGDGGGAFSSGTAGTIYNGGNATDNTGGGGGGANFKTNGSGISSTGGNGAAGYVKVVYWA